MHLRRIVPSVGHLVREADQRGWSAGQLADLLEQWSDDHWYPPQDLRELEEEVLL
jgi:hypothetical protein